MIFKKEQTVKFQHCDYAGIVFYPRFMEMWNELIEDWFHETLDFSFSDIHKKKMGVPTVKLNVEFLSPAKIYDVLEKQLSVVQIGNTSVSVQIKFVHVETQKTVLQGTSVLVCTDTLKSKPWSSEIKKKMESFLID